MAKLILTSEVTGLGAAGDVVTVKDGYARNYLVPRGLATRWTRGAQKQVDILKAARRKRAIENIEDARAVRDSLAETTVTLEARAGENGRLFGAVSTRDIADAIKAQVGAAVDAKKIELASPIKTVGEYRASIRLHPEVSVTLNLSVAAAK